MKKPDITIRDIDGQIEMKAVEALQKEVWGGPDLDVVPLTQLIAAKASGGALIGAFDKSHLVGFAYGFVGYEEGHLTHHSHMLAVKQSYRTFNVGYDLKLAQRDRVLQQGIDRMTWTFDPLQSLNAYFNFNKLGVVSDKYFVNFYGEEAGSFLHQNGTDRLWVTWLLDSLRVRVRLEMPLASFDRELPSLIAVGAELEPIRNELDLDSEQTVIEIPGDINKIEQTFPDIAVRWRTETRWAFNKLLAKSYLVGAFHRAKRGDDEIGRYVLCRNKTVADIE